MTVYINGVSSNTTAITENVATISAANSKTNLTSYQEWEGDYVEITNQSAIQIASLFDKDVMVYIDQSIDGLTAFKTYSWVAPANVGFSRAVTSVAPYYQVRLTNLSVDAATGEMASAATAVFNILPESTDINGNLKLGTLTDINNMIAMNTPQGEMRTITPFRLVGSQMELTGNAGAVDPNYWSTLVDATAGPGSVTVANSLCNISSGTNAASWAKVSSIRRARYVSGYTNRMRGNFRLATNQANNTKRFGVAFYSNYTFTITAATASVGDIYSNNSQYFTVTQPCAAGTTLYCTGTGAPGAPGNLVKVSGAAGSTDPIVFSAAVAAWTISDGAFFQMAGSTFSCQIYKNGTPTPITTFNGQLGTVYTPSTNVHTCEIYYTNAKVYFVIDGYLLHTFSASTTSWSATMNLFIYLDNINSGNTTNTILGLRNAAIHRMGPEMTQPMSYYFASGKTAGTGTVLKYGAGNIKGVNINSAVDNAVVVLYDGLANTYRTIVSWTLTNASYRPVMFDLYGIPFYNGLTLEVKTQNASVTVIYE